MTRPLPEHLVPTLTHKLQNQIFDAGITWALRETETTGRRELVVVADEGVNKDNVWIIDHMVSFESPKDARAALRQVPGLMDRVLGLDPSVAERYDGDANDSPLLEKALEVLWRFSRPLKTRTGEIGGGGTTQNLASVVVGWYVEDEVGSAVCDAGVHFSPWKRANETALGNGHAEANVATTLVSAGGSLFTVLWPLRHLPVGTVAVREDVTTMGGGKAAVARPMLTNLTAARSWIEGSFSNQQEVEELKEAWAGALEAWESKLQAWAFEPVYVPTPTTGLPSLDQLLPERCLILSSLTAPATGGTSDDKSAMPKTAAETTTPREKDRLRIYTDLPWMASTLNDPRFQLVQTLEEEADVYFMQEEATKGFFEKVCRQRRVANEADMGHAGHDIRVGLCRQNSRVVVNQFPFEGCFVCKDHLAALLARAGCAFQGWCIPTYDLEVNLPAFLGDFLRIQEENDDEHQNPPLFILKPPRLGRSIGHIVSSSLPQILAHLHAASSENGCGDGSGSSSFVAQRYITRPHLLHDGGRKYDLRVVALLRPPPTNKKEAEEAKPTTATIAQLEVLVHRHVWVRAANKAHSSVLTSPEALDDPEATLTAMHLLGFESRHPRLDELIAQIQQENETCNDPEKNENGWDRVLEEMHGVVRTVFAAAMAQQPGFRLAAHEGTRASVYGFDFMLTHTTSSESEHATPGPLQPVLLEVTYSPSDLAVHKAMPEVVEGYSNDIAAALFFGETPDSLLSLGMVEAPM